LNKKWGRSLNIYEEKQEEKEWTVAMNTVNDDLKLLREIYNQYRSLIKWIVGLSFGGLLLGINTAPESITLGYYSALFMMFLSGLLGVWYVKLSIDYSYYKLENNFKNNFYDEIKTKIDVTQKKSWQKSIAVSFFKQKFLREKMLPFLFNLSIVLFFIGIIIFSVCKYHHIVIIG
jgi:hypothetical protein